MLDKKKENFTTIMLEEYLANRNLAELYGGEKTEKKKKACDSDEDDDEDEDEENSDGGESSEDQREPDTDEEVK